MVLSSEHDRSERLGQVIERCCVSISEDAWHNFNWEDRYRQVDYFTIVLADEEAEKISTVQTAIDYVTAHSKA